MSSSMMTAVAPAGQVSARHDARCLPGRSTRIPECVPAGISATTSSQMGACVLAECRSADAHGKAVHG